MQNLKHLLRELPPLPGRVRQKRLYREHSRSGMPVSYAESDRTDQISGLEHRIDEAPPVLIQSSGMVRKLLIRKIRVLAAHLSQIDRQIEDRRCLSRSILAHLDRAKMSLRNDELRLEALSESYLRDPSGLSKAVTTSQTHQLNREIVREQQQAFRDGMRLQEEKRKLEERCEQYRQSLRVFAQQ